MKNFFGRLAFLLSPTAIGLYITLASVGITFKYFDGLSRTTEELPFISNLLSTAHQKSIDFRLKARGERPGSPQVGLLTVDEKAVASVGRWPWPREVLAQAISNAIRFGAKVIAFDIVFSEPSYQPAREILQKLQSKGQLSEEMETQLKLAVSDHDSDSKMAEILSPISEHIVFGSFSDVEEYPYYDGYREYCNEFIFQLSPAYKRWNEREAVSMIVLDPVPLIPYTLSEAYKDHLNHIAESFRSSQPKPKNSIEEHEIRNRIEGLQAKYCDQWLNPIEDELFPVISEAWPTVLQAESEEFQQSFPTFQSWVQFLKSKSPSNGVPLAKSWTMDLDRLTASAETVNTGYFNAFLDSDGSIRKSGLVLRSGINTYTPSIALKAFLVANNYNGKIEIAYNPKIRQKEIDSLSITSNETGNVVFNLPVDGRGRLAINYAGPRSMFPYISLADLLDSSEFLTYSVREKDPKTGKWTTKDHQAKKSEFLKDKLFILGATAIGIFDLRVTPFDENFPGAETHVNVLDNLMRRDFLRTDENEELYMMGSLLAIGLILTLALSHFGAITSFTLASVLFAGTLLVDRYFLFGKGIVVTIILPLSLILILFIILISYKYFTEERGKKELRSTFQKYVSPSIVEEILSDPSKLELGGRKARVTIFFSDVRGFTSISEKLDPRALSDLLNSYLTPMTDLVFKNNGTLDKYMGDAIMAFFGAPLSYPDHAKYACRCALQHLKKLSELRKQYAAKGLPDIDIGIGLNTGDVSVGNMGSQTVRSYTVMGDAVNLASRLEGTNKQYGTHIIISEFTYEDIKSDFVCREIDRVRVKGKAQPVKIYELIAEGRPTEELDKHLSLFNDGYRLYHSRMWNDALEKFNSSLNVSPEDKVSRLYITRCQDYLSTPPPDDWDGVFVMKTK